MNKIFCIGPNKTGTSSLHRAFEILGFKSVHRICREGNIKKIIIENQRAGANLLDGIDKYDAYSDWNNVETNYSYKLLDEQNPGSKFILNTRDLEDWLRSREAHVKRIKNLEELKAEYPDSTWFNMDKEAWTEEFEELHRDIWAYFEDRPNDLLTIDICAGEGWEKLCPFLDVKVPQRKFPHANPTKSVVKAVKKILSGSNRASSV